MNNSIDLPHVASFLNGQMECRLYRPLDPKEMLVMVIPGGPGLGNVYLDSFMRKLAEKTGLNTGVMDLPNHGNSKISPDKLPLSYQSCITYIRETLDELNSHCGGLVLFGQSFGARVSFDLIAELKVLPKLVLLTGFPYIFKISSALLQQIQTLELEPMAESDLEEVFARNGLKILPFYTRHPLPKDIFTKLASGSKLTGNEQILNTVPPIQEAIGRLEKIRTSCPPIEIIEGEFDTVVPDTNWETLKDLIPSANFHRISDAGHFVMIEKPQEILLIFSEFIQSIKDR